MHPFKSAVFAASAAFLPAIAAAQAPNWTYNPNSRDAPQFWGSLAPQYATCGSANLLGQNFTQVGLNQTPIDIVSAKAIPGVLPRLSFHYKHTALNVENTGHVIQVVYQSGSYLQWGKDVTNTYNLVQFHFHAPSEHTVDGKSFDGELHLNHTNLLGEQVIVAVFLQQDSKASAGVYDDILAKAPSSVSVNSGGTLTVNASDLLPKDTQAFYAYNGSGSTPPCAEGVRRIVFTQAVNVTPNVIKQLHSLAGGFVENAGYPNNNRPITPANGRSVLIVR
jgi:carbonic anhydrase